MGLVLVGIDEAGYGPRLGPLCVACAEFRVDRWAEGDAAPDLWKLLRKAVARTPDRRGARLAVADSKRLKLANDSRSRHPLCHLERATLAVLRSIGHDVRDDAMLLDTLGARAGTHPCYGGESLPLPVGMTAAEVGIAANRLADSMAGAGVATVGLACEIVDEPTLNDIVRRTGSKASATVAAIGRHLRRAVERHGCGPEPLRIVCDRLGGRTAYRRVLEGEGFSTEPLEESHRRSRYTIARDGRSAIVQFMPEAESAHLPVALASMTAKYVRELAMARFNRYWCALDPALKPTAGYATDARRWLVDAAPIVGDADRSALIRIA